MTHDQRPVTSIHFYHLTSTPLERALPKLLERCYSGGFRTIVLADEARVESLNELLWTYDAASFLPHGSKKDGHVDSQPILICHSAARASESAESTSAIDPALTLRIPQDTKTILLLTNGTLAEHPASYNRVIDMFDGGDAESLSAARRRWKQYKEMACELHYYQQTSSGSWDKRD